MRNRAKTARLMLFVGVSLAVVAVYLLLMSHWRISESETNRTLPKEVVREAHATKMVSKLMVDNAKSSPIEPGTPNLEQSGKDIENAEAMPSFAHDTTRIFHVTRSGTAVEGALLVKVAHTRVKKVVMKFFDPTYWKLHKCGRSYRFLPGGCYWCPLDPSKGACTPEGTFIVSQFRDDHRAYSLLKRGTIGLIKMRPATVKGTEGKADIDQVYATCEDLKNIPVDVPGLLRVRGMDSFMQFVNPRPPNRVRSRSKSIVCAKAFYGTEINARTVYQFVRHYLHTWRFDHVFVYELGTTVGILLKDVIMASPQLLKYMQHGRLVYIDLRDELQRMYGPIAGDVVLFSSKNGQMVVESDCLNRAKQSHVDWVLALDWDEILTYGRDFKEIPNPRPTFTKWIRSFNKIRDEITGSDVRLAYLRRVIATEDSMCSKCSEDWDEERAHQHHLANEAVVDYQNATNLSEPDDEDDQQSESTDDGLFVEDDDGNESKTTLKKIGVNREDDDTIGVPIEFETKYIVRISSDKYPLSWAYGVHVLSRCAFSLNNFGRYIETLNPGVLYLRHYKCMNKRSPCDVAPRYPLNWGWDFGNLTKLKSYGNLQ